MAGAVRVIGLRELQRDFKKISKSLSKELRDELKEAAKPVADEGEMLALGKIQNMPRSPRWAEMRIGVTATSVYVAPQARRAGGSPRRKFADLLMDRAMEPALENKRGEVLEGVDDMLDHLFDRNGF